MSNLNTDYLYKKSNDPQLSVEMNEIAKAIEFKILENHRMGLCELTFELPENFSIKNLDRCDAQLIIYSRLIEYFEEKGFLVGVKLTETDGSFIRVKWPSALDPQEKKRMQNVIKSHTFT